MILLDLYKDKRVGVIGFGITGKAIVDSLIAGGAEVVLYEDIKINLSDKYLNNVLLKYSSDFVECDVFVVSPGIPLRWPVIHPIVRKAYELGIPVVNDIDLFQRCVSSQNKLICVTGTNGKSTTTALINHIFQCSQKKSVVGGNFGPPVLSLSRDHDFYVIEISSYQLESCRILGFDTSILLNITPDHLSRHGGMHGYISAKQKIFSNFKNTSKAIIGIDDVYCNEIYEFLKYINHPNAIPISGNTVPDFGVGWNNEYLIDNRFGKYEKICEKNPLLDGMHNRQNIAAAYVVCVVNNIEQSEFLKALKLFQGLPHRQELVAEINGIQYVNDSKATNAQSVEQALMRFDDILWILGGRPKEDGIESLIKYSHKIKYAFLIGEAAYEWNQLLQSNEVSSEISRTLDAALIHAYEKSEILDAKVVLLSPACASFDQFKNFEARGEKFKELVAKLKRKSR